MNQYKLLLIIICVLFIANKSFAGEEYQALDSVKESEEGVNGLITSNWEDYFNITRLQTRLSDNGRKSFNQSTFIRFPSKLFIVESFDHTEKFKDDPDVNFLEIIIGGPIKTFENPELLGWVVRAQASTGINPEYSLGLQYNIDKHSSIKNILKEKKITTFLQLFPIRSNTALGKYDLLHYYSLPIYSAFYVRGYNRWFHFENKRDYVLLFQDFILPINSKIDSYIRHTYQNRNDFQYGEKGSDLSLGFRLNYSF